MSNMLKSQDNAIEIPQIRHNTTVRPTSGVIRRDLDMHRVVLRPASAYSTKRTTVKELAALD